MSNIVRLPKPQLGDYEKMSQSERQKEAIKLAVFHAKEFKSIKKEYEKLYSKDDQPREVYLYLRKHNEVCNGCIK